MKTYITLALSFFVMLCPSTFAELFGGIEFPDGALSFADEVISFDPAYSGGSIPDPEYMIETDILGPPDYSGGNFQPGAISLGSGGRIIIKFTNNKLTGSDDTSPDLHIFEIGTGVEDTFVDISIDGTNWYSVGKVEGATDSIDIDAFGFTSSNEFSYVRLTDDPNEGGTSGSTIGADIDAVGAISTTPTQDTPDLEIETAILVQFQSALGSFYAIEESTNLTSWTDAVVDIEGDGDVKKFFFEITTPEKFYRLKPPEE